MATKLIAPLVGEGVEELNIINWLKQVGDHVDEMESIVEVETDKVVTEFPSPVAGTLLSIDVPAGGVVKVGESMGLIGESGEETSAGTAEGDTSAAPKAQGEGPKSEPVKAAPTSEQAPAPQAAPVEAEAEQSGFLSPLVKKMLAENNINAANIQGTGKDGRVTKADVEAYLEAGKPAARPERQAAPTPAKLPAEAPAAVVSVPEGAVGALIPHSTTRRRIAEHMVMSKRTSPHVLSVVEADMSRVLRHRKELKTVMARDGVNLTLTAYFVSAIVQALKTYPLLNSMWADEGQFVFKDVNLGMAVARGEAGLIVPVIHQAQNLSLQGLAEKINDLAARARDNKLKPEEVRGGTFTLTNHGTGGSLFAMPVINQPQMAILGTGIMQKRPIVVTDAEGNDSLAIRPMVYLSLVFDHRAIDGEAADNFLVKVKETLENWE